MPHLIRGSTLTNQVFWSVVAFLGNFVAFILIRGSEFYIDQIKSEEQKWQISTVLVSAEFIIPTLLFCNFVWGPQIRNKSHNNLFLNVALTYFCFLVLAIAAHLSEYPKFRIKMEEKEHNPKKIRNLYTTGAFAISSLGLSKAMKLQFEIGFFSFCIAYAMEVSLGILRENGRGRNWFYIVSTAIFCFLLILIRKYLDGLQEKQGTNADADGHGQRRNQPPNASMVNDSVNMEIVEAGLQRRSTQPKDRLSLNDNTDSNTGEQNHRRHSSVNDERGEREESWSVDEEHWESIPPRGDTETNSAGDSEDTPLPLSPQIGNIGTPPVQRSLDQCQESSCQGEDQENSSARDFEDNQPPTQEEEDPSISNAAYERLPLEEEDPSMPLQGGGNGGGQQQQCEGIELLPCVKDRHGGVIVNMKKPMDSKVFGSLLNDSLSDWREQGKKGVWIKLPLGLSSLVDVAVKAGFRYHHAERDYLMLVHWIPNTPDTLPANASHRVGIGAFVMNTNGEVLVVQETKGIFRGTGVWKLPTGIVNEGEDICTAAIREVQEETGIETEFVEVLAFGQSHRAFFQKSDLFFVCMLQPRSFNIETQASEIEAAQWMPVKDYAAQPYVRDNELFDFIAKICLSKLDGNYSGLKPLPTTTSSGKKTFLYFNNRDASTY